MTAKRYAIQCRDKRGRVFTAFHWLGDPEHGIQRARAEAEKFHANVVDVWAKELPPHQFDKAIPDYGDLMTTEEFDGCCQQGLFTDDDGSGRASNGEMMCDRTIVVPSNRHVTLVGASHVVWFNR